MSNQAGWEWQNQLLDRERRESESDEYVVEMETDISSTFEALLKEMNKDK